eukprot:scaffold15104_cov31-Tisochrysis_lutea.AAC.4
MGWGWPRQAMAGEWGEPVEKELGQQGSVLPASHQACHENGGDSSPMPGEEAERGGGSCPLIPYGRTEY